MENHGRDECGVSQNVKDFIAERDLFAKHLGISVDEVAPGRAKVSMRVGDEHLNGLGIVHGGATFALADLAFACASNSHGNAAVAISAQIFYTAAAQKGALLTAEAVETSLNPKLATYDVEVKAEDGALIATFHGMVYRKKHKVGETPQGA
jgi:acyl-CoA thioesterase